MYVRFDVDVTSYPGVFSTHHLLLTLLMWSKQPTVKLEEVQVDLLTLLPLSAAG